MPSLTIRTSEPLGPLRIEIIDAAARRLRSAPALTSTLTEIVVRDVPPGDYTILATRPSGEVLATEVRVTPNGGQATIAPTIAPRSDLLRDATRLGLAPSATRPDETLRDLALRTPPSANTVVRALGSLMKANRAESGLGDAFYQLVEDDIPAAPTHAARQGLRLRAWRFAPDAGWTRRGLLTEFMVKGGGDFLQIQSSSETPAALALVDDRGFGPIVIVPPFRGGVSVTFLAAGVALSRFADRAENPSAARVPVALGVPRDPLLADLLLGLSAPSLPGATSILGDEHPGAMEGAFSILVEKSRDPAGAVLAAMFLARYAPERLPLHWLVRVESLLPGIADPEVLMGAIQADQGRSAVPWSTPLTEILRGASQRRCVFFSRARQQLNQLTRLHGPYPRARQDSVSKPRRARPGDYLDFAAEAGGLESFWGRSPTRPGPDDHMATGLHAARTAGLGISFVDGQFAPTSFVGPLA
jgi:hypothetical protein